MNAKVVLNTAHSLLPAQKELLIKNFGSAWELLGVPEEGWTAEQIFGLAESLNRQTVIFASPVPLLIALCATQQATGVGIFHNDKRVAKEVPDGKGGVKLIHTVAPDGWELICVDHEIVEVL